MSEFRNLESLLLSDFILFRFCEEREQLGELNEIKAARDSALADSINQGKAGDDLKPTAQAVHQAAKRLLRLDRSGSTKQAFMIKFLAPLVTPGTEVYKKLERDIFG